MDDVRHPIERRYADAETEAILKRAAELQGTAEPPTSPTLTDLQQIADEAGIDQIRLELGNATQARQFIWPDRRKPLAPCAGGEGGPLMRQLDDRS